MRRAFFWTREWWGGSSTPPGCVLLDTMTGGLRVAATSGYHLAPLCGDWELKEIRLNARAASMGVVTELSWKNIGSWSRIRVATNPSVKRGFCR